MNNKLLFNGKYIIFGTFLTTLALFSLWSNTSSWWQILVSLFYFGFFGIYLGGWFLNKERKIWQLVFGVISLFGLLIIVLSGIYWFYRIDKEIIAFVLVLLPILISLQKNKELELFDDVTKIDLEAYSYIKSHLGTKILGLIVFGGQALLFYTLFTKRFTDTLISPWTIIGPKFFLVFFITSILLLWVVQKSKHTLSNLLLIVIHTSLILNVALIIFKIGFGFDPFIHQATEKWISENGFILPKQPYYIGQYMLIVALNFITKISITSLDKSLVPVLSGIITPLVAYFGLSKINLRHKLIPALALVPLLPMSFFIMTTPNNLALLLSLVIVFWIWYEIKNNNNKTNLFGLILVFTTICIHPLVGLPLFFIYTGSILYKKTKFKIFFYSLYTTILTLILPLTFYLNAKRLGQDTNFGNPLRGLDGFWSLFARPHYYWIDKGDWFWRSLYYYRDAIVPLFIIVAMLGIFFATRKYKIKQTYFFVTTIVGLFISAFILSASLNFTDVIFYEQGSYAGRILTMILIILLPFFIISLRELFIFVKKQPTKQFGLAIIFSALLLVSWYFTYPTRDQVSYHTGHSVRSADITTVHFIDNLNKGKKDYIVLTNQLVSAAALREFSFVNYLKTPAGEQYFYSVPTGGPLYQYFRKMVYQEPKRQWMEQAMNFAGVKKAYFVHTNYWAPAGEIRDAAKLESDNWWELENGRVWVYEYLLNAK
ncbi:MAG: hypothetical protein HOA57_02235 [Candidatus Magasanikbacteria bacterium]|nr:hypothetical protein [Candidatus Magasanikbacteria bacterium]